MRKEAEGIPSAVAEEYADAKAVVTSLTPLQHQLPLQKVLSPKVHVPQTELCIPSLAQTTDIGL